MKNCHNEMNFTGLYTGDSSHKLLSRRVWTRRVGAGLLEVR